MYLDSLMAVLRKHRIRLQSQEHAAEYDAGSSDLRAAETNALVPGKWIIPIEKSTDENAFDSLDFDGVWQSYIDLDLSMDPQSWDALISDIENLYPSTEHLEMPTG